MFEEDLEKMEVNEQEIPEFTHRRAKRCHAMYARVRTLTLPVPNKPYCFCLYGPFFFFFFFYEGFSSKSLKDTAHLIVVVETN